MSMSRLIEGIDKGADRKAKYDAAQSEYHRTQYAAEDAIKRHEKAKSEVSAAEARVKMATLELEGYRVALADYAKIRKDAEKVAEKAEKAWLAAYDRLPQ
jgi:hypothetical protein